MTQWFSSDQVIDLRQKLICFENKRHHLISIASDQSENVDFYGSKTIMIGENKLLKFSNIYKYCHLVTVNKDQNTFTFEDRASREFQLAWFATVNFRNMHVYLVGGRQGGRNGLCMPIVERYTIEDDVWDQLPELNHARAGASCCIVGLTTYVFGGMTQQRKRLDIIESMKFDIKGNP